jgi:hypothetical protein
MPQLNSLGDATARRANRRVTYRLLETVEHVGDAASHNPLAQDVNRGAGAGGAVAAVIGA